jgi:hypothetical protein
VRSCALQPPQKHLAGVAAGIVTPNDIDAALDPFGFRAMLLQRVLEEFPAPCFSASPRFFLPTPASLGLEKQIGDNQGEKRR